jgi:hypothetical protein
MRILTTLAVATALAVSACGQNGSGALAPVKTSEAELGKLAQTLRTEAYKEKAGAPVDVAGLIAALPKVVKVTYASAGPDAASGATVLKSVKITPADNEAVGVAINELKLWGFDSELAKARLAGQRLTETKKLANRIEADAISIFGLESVISQALPAETKVIEGVAGGGSTVAAAMPNAISKYDFSVARVVFDDVVLRPWEMNALALPDDNPLKEIMPILQPYIAFTRTLGVDAAAMFDMKGVVAFDQMGMTNSVDMGIDTIAYRGWRGWDTDLGIIKGMRYKVDIKAPDSAPAPAKPAGPLDANRPIPIAVDESVATAVVSGMRLDKVMGYLARGQMPPRTETDLMAVGVIRLDDMQIGMNGQPFYAMGKMSLDLSHFHWLVPNAGRLQIDDMVYDVKGIMDMVASTAGPLATEFGAQPDQVDPKILQALAKYGLDKPSLDFNLGWNWNPKTGDSTLDFATGLDAWTRFDIKGNFGAPTFDAVSALIPDKGEPNEQALQELLTKTFSVKSAEANFIDEGGFEKGFALAAELGDLAPASDPQMAMLKGKTAQQLRGVAYNAAYLMADTAGQQVPAARDLLRPFAAWLSTGGKVHVTVKPAKPLTAAELQAASATPDGAVKALNLKVVHEPPPGTPKPKTN